MNFLKSKFLQKLLIICVIFITFMAFIWYTLSHPEILDTILDIRPITLIFLAVAYLLTVAANSFILHSSLSYLNHRTPILDNVLLTGYSSIINFFGPLQSGPGFRAIYLKKKYGILMKNFLLTNLIFYLFFAIINAAVVILAGYIQKPEWRTYIVSTILTLMLLIYLAIGVSHKKMGVYKLIKAIKPQDKNFWLIGAGALALTLSSGMIYFIELREFVSVPINLWQVLIYTAASNLSLFVSLTPGAIGFREAFLLISQQLHGITTSSIVTISIVDRSFYVFFLLIMFIVLLIINSYKKVLPSIKYRK